MTCLNDAEEFDIDTYGLQAAVRGLWAACRNKADRAREAGDIGSEARAKAWEADKITLERILPLLLNDKPRDEEKLTDEERGRVKSLRQRMED